MGLEDSFERMFSDSLEDMLGDGCVRIGVALVEDPDNEGNFAVVASLEGDREVVAYVYGREMADRFMALLNLLAKSSPDERQDWEGL